ncbi:MAG: sec-independent protein translocase protein TatB [Flavobacteriales bacterium]|jgi:sec-independent protein translocase protein TatB
MSFAEFFVVIVVGLLVIGPQRLPEAIRTGMLWFGKIKRAVNDTRAELEQQLGVDEIRRELHNDRVLDSLKALEQTRDDIQSGLQKESHDIKASFDSSLKNTIGKFDSVIDTPSEPHAPNYSESDARLVDYEAPSEYNPTASPIGTQDIAPDETLESELFEQEMAAPKAHESARAEISADSDGNSDGNSNSNSTNTDKPAKPAAE